MSSDLEENARIYAWNYFSLHAGRRMTGFHFFIAIVGVSILARVTLDYVRCAVERHRPKAGVNPARQTVAPAGSDRSG